ncbi:unnamed protein product [Chondrus crispus]|uniref:Uncharacterized protein n=1 Tax=Chondrus crispus TaxID=2769 RepID=R7QI24_CHOCR|nr:unnamed protein product [Chondrus crispus]CDF37055.1 unnamed protein product [Chondrus crispus]|eukprot:XP_005716874.1 unnamed protein product [Chondrus crispus]
MTSISWLQGAHQGVSSMYDKIRGTGARQEGGCTYSRPISRRRQNVPKTKYSKALILPHEWLPY